MHSAACVIALMAGLLFPAASASATPASTPEAAAPDGSIGVRLLDAPAGRRDDPRARLYIVDHLAPGTTIERRIEVSNSTSQAADISVYAGAAAIEDGTFAIADARTPNELTTWVSLDRSIVDVPAGGQSPVRVTIDVPDDASAGERYGVIWAELAGQAPDDGGVTVVNRVGIRLYLSVGPGGEPASDFQVDTLTAERTSDGQPIVNALVHNTGGRALDMSGSLQLSNGPGGLSAGPFPAELGTTLAPGDSEAVTVLLDPRLPDGPWDARLDLTSGLITRTAEATITFPADAGRAAPVPAQDTGWGLRWVVLILGAALLVALLLFLLLRRRRRRQERDQPPGPRDHDPGDRRRLP